MTSVKNIEELMQNLNAIYYVRIGEGEKADFYMMLNEYKDSLRITFCVVNPKTMWLGGKFGIPLEFAPKLFAHLGRILRIKKQIERGIESEQRNNK